MGMKKKEINYQLLIRRICLIVLDIICIIAASILALLTRFEFDFSQIPKEFLKVIYKYGPFTIVITLIIFSLFRIYSSLWEYAGIEEVFSLIAACLAAAVAKIVIILFTWSVMPRSWYVLDTIYLMILIGATRVSYRLIRLRRQNRTFPWSKRKKVMIIGGGEAGRSLITEIQNSKYLDQKDDEMIDIHAHILPGIDDGAEDMYDTLEMARMAADSGVDRIIATPHCNIPGMYGNYFGREYIDRYESVVRAVRKEKIPIEILPGMEVFSTEDLPELIVNHKIMPLNQSRYILMEFAFDEDPEFADSILKRVEEVGARPVIAHAERYEFIQDYPQIAYRWFRKGYVIQANKGSFLGRFGGGPKRAADSLLRHNLISVIASDAHSPLQRTPYMMDVYEELSREYSENHLDVLFQYNPARICDNREILRLEPVPYSGRQQLY